MTNIRRVFLAHLAVAVGGLAAGYAIEGQWIIACVFLLLGGLWLLANRRGVPGLGGLLMYVYLLALAAGFWLGIPGLLALLASVGALGAWDLGHFMHRLSAAEHVEFESGLGSAHLRRLAAVEGLGFLAGLLAINVRLVLPFWWVVLLVALAVMGLTRLVDFVRKQFED